MPWRAVTAAMMGILVGIGLARFAYTPLLPVLIAQGWFAPGAAAYLGAANLLGYLGGALLARRLGARFGAAPVLRVAMLLAALSLAACSVRLPFLWFFGWRLLSGIVGGVLMILGPSSALAHVPPARRGLASGVIITGVGLGIATSGTLVPLLLRAGLAQAWLGLALSALLLTAAAWRGWPASPVGATPPDGAPARFGAASLSYGICGVGMVPHMVFLVDFVARGLGRGIGAGAFTWVLYGVGALSGATMAGRLADRFGPAATMRCIIGLQAVTVATLLLSADAVVVAVSVLLSGMLGPAVSAVMLGRVGQLAGSDGAARQRGWTQATVFWAVGQAGGAYGMAWLYGESGGYAALFVAALAALGASAAIEASLALRPQRRMPA